MLIAFTAMTLELNRFGKDLNKIQLKPKVLYVSNSFISAICGGVLSLAFNMVTDNFTIIIISGILGTFIGVNSFKIIFKIFINTFDFLKGEDFTNMFNE